VSEVHSEVHSAVGSYIADALEAAERVEFEGHLSHCGSCRQEVVEFDETTAELARLVAVQPPSSVRERVLAGVHQVRPLPPELPIATRPASTKRTELSHRFLASTGPSVHPDWEHPRDDPSEQRSWRRARVLTAAVAAATVASLALGGWVVVLLQQEQALTAERQVDAAAAQRRTDLLGAPDAKLLTSSGKDGARYSFVVSKERDSALFIGTDLPDPGPGKTYQLWTLAGQTASPDHLVRGYGRTSRWFTGPIRTATGLAVTIEAAAGSTKPSLPILATAKI
jgi:anti-sigma factor RsiW